MGKLNTIAGLVGAVVLLGATQSLAAGGAAYEHADIEPGNMYKALEGFRRARDLLEALPTKPTMYQDALDFIDRVDIQVLNKRTIESMIKAGAFDSLGYSRRGLLEVSFAIVDATLDRRRAEEAGQYSLFGGSDGPAADMTRDVPDHECE